MIDLAVGAALAGPVVRDRRRNPRVPYDAYVAFVLVAPTGERGPITALKAREISLNGIGVVSRQMIYPGSCGAMQLVRSDGRAALVGVKVSVCRYVGEMRHHTGMSFMPLPNGIWAEEFLDKHGRMMLMNPLLRKNIAP